MITAFLKPENNTLKIRMPDSGDYLPEDGAEVVLTGFWRRRIKDGDVIEVTDHKPAKTRKEKGE